MTTQWPVSGSTSPTPPPTNAEFATQITELVARHLAVHPTLRLTQLQAGRNWLSGQADQIEAVLEHLVADDQLGKLKVRGGRRSYTMYYDKGFALYLAAYLQLHGSISEAEFEVMCQEELAYVQRTQRTQAGAVLRHGRWLLRIILRLQRGEELQAAVDELDIAIQAAEVALGAQAVANHDDDRDS